METLTIMCDYSADGLWVDGSATSYELLIEEYNFPEYKELQDKITNWQEMYETFNFYTSEEISKTEMDKEEFTEFMDTGASIFLIIKSIVKEHNLPFEVEYFNEETNERLK